jgi:hypothetical protein
MIFHRKTSADPDPLSYILRRNQYTGAPPECPGRFSDDHLRKKQGPLRDFSGLWRISACFAHNSLSRAEQWEPSNEDIETMKGAERPETRSTSPIDHIRDRRR